MRRFVRMASLLLFLPAIAYAQPSPPTSGQRPPPGHTPPDGKGKPPPSPSGEAGQPRPPEGERPPDGKGQPPQQGQPPSDGSAARGPGGPPDGRGGGDGPGWHGPRGPERAKEITNGRQNLPEAKNKAKDNARKDLSPHYARARDEQARSEIRTKAATHAQRQARLARLREIAEKKGDTAAVNRIDALTTKEENRHARWLESAASTQ